VSDDRRVDPETRSRVDDLEASWHEAVKGLDRRYRRVTWWLLGGMVIVLLACALGYAALQGQRWDQTRDGCERSNRITEATVGLLRDLKVEPAMVELAERRYPHVPPLITPPRGYSGPRTCSGFADEHVGRLRL
jgi:hypothetical protein